MNFNENVNIYTRLFLIALLVRSHGVKAKRLAGRHPDKLSEHADKCIELIKYLQNGAMWVESLEEHTLRSSGIEYGWIHGLPAEIAGDKTENIQQVIAEIIIMAKHTMFLDNHNTCRIRAGSVSVNIEDTEVTFPNTVEEPNSVMLMLNATLGHVDIDRENFAQIDFCNLVGIVEV